MTTSRKPTQAPPPEWLSPRAKQIWRENVPAGRLSIFESLFALVCESRVLVEQLEAEAVRLGAARTPALDQLIEDCREASEFPDLPIIPALPDRPAQCCRRDRRRRTGGVAIDADR